MYQGSSIKAEKFIKKNKEDEKKNHLDNKKCTHEKCNSNCTKGYAFCQFHLEYFAQLLSAVASNE